MRPSSSSFPQAPENYARGASEKRPVWLIDRSPGSKSFGRRLTLRLLTIAASVSLALFIAEIAIRVTSLAPTSFYTYDPDLGWTMKADTSGWQRQEGDAYVRVNHDGFRGPDYPLRKPSNMVRIAVLGDSFTEAQQVAEEDTFCAVAQARLQSLITFGASSGQGQLARRERIEVLNFGCDGYGTAQELITLRKRVWRYAPDVVVLAVFTGNDIRNNSVILEGDKCRPFYVFAGPRLTLSGPFEDSFWFRTNCMLRFESRHSQVLNLLGDSKSIMRQWLHARFGDAQHSSPYQQVGSEPGLNDEIYRAPKREVSREAWRITDGEIEMVQRDVAAHHARLLVVTLANGIQDDPDPVFRERYAHFVGASDLFYPDDHISALGQRDGFPVLNLAPAMQQYAEIYHEYLHGFVNTHPGIGHWNAEGHRVAGELIAQRLIELLRQGPEK